MFYCCYFRMTLIVAIVKTNWMEVKLTHEISDKCIINTKWSSHIELLILLLIILWQHNSQLEYTNLYLVCIYCHQVSCELHRIMSLLWSRFHFFSIWWSIQILFIVHCYVNKNFMTDVDEMSNDRDRIVR